MSLKKITEAAVRVIRDLPVRPTGPTGRYSAAQLQAFFDKTAINIRGFFNDLIDELDSENGAADIGFKATTGVNARTVQEAVENVQAQIAGTAMGTIPDGSITGAKMATGGLLEDVTEDVTWTASETSSEFNSADLHFYYCRALGIVFVRGMIKGVLAEPVDTMAGSNVHLHFTVNGYTPKSEDDFRSGVRMELDIYNAVHAATFSFFDHDVVIYVTDSELTDRLNSAGFTEGYYGNLIIGGWYFCDGE